MNLRPGKHSPFYAGLTPLLAVSIFWAVTLTVCPELHEWIHPDADHEDHDCAVTLFASGGIDFAAIDPVDLGKPAYRALADVLQLDSQVLVSAQTERLIPGRGPPENRWH